MKNTLKNAGSILLGICFLLFILTLPILFIKGALWLAPIALPWLNLIGAITFIVCIFIFLPLGAFRRTRMFAGLGLFFASYIFGLSLWFAGFLLTYMYWGGLALVIGLFIAGIGVVPIAMLASALHSDWPVFLGLLFSVFCTFGARMFSSHLVEKAEKEKYEMDFIEVGGVENSPPSA